MPISLHAKRRILYIKTESATPGTFVTGTVLFAVGNAVIPPQSIKFQVKPDFTDRKVDGPSLQPLKSVAGAQQGTCSFSTRLIGPASKGVAGPLSDLFKSAAMKETLVATTSATANPATAARCSASGAESRWTDER